MGLAALHDRVFDSLTGRHPERWITHPQYLATRDLNADLREILPELSGVLLDLGSRDKPYGPWVGPAVTEHIGADVQDGPGVDVVIVPGDSLPFEDCSVDAVLCTQVLEFVTDPDDLLADIRRILRPGGVLVITMPFTYNEHPGDGGADLYRWTAPGAAVVVGRHLDIAEVRRQGRLGSTVVPFTLNWIRVAMSGRRRWLRGILLPVLLPLYALSNALGLAIDRLDTTERFYTNVLVKAQRSP